MSSLVGLRQWTFDNVLVALAFFFTAWAGQTLAFPPFIASVVCPASGVALAATVLRGLHVWPGVLAGTFAILVKVLVVGGGAPLAAGLACAFFVGAAQAVQAVLGGILFRRWVGDPTFGSPGIALRYAGVAAITAVVGSTGAVASLVGFGFVQAELLPEITVWAVGRTAGMLIFTPAILLCARVRDCTLLRERAGEAVLLFATIVLGAQAVFGLSAAEQSHYPLEYLIFPGLLWALVRFGSRELGVLVALVSVIATFATANHMGPFAQTHNPQEALILMELYFGVMTISSLLGGSIATQRNRAQRELEAAHRDLERRVAQRTHELQAANARLQSEIAERQLLAKAFEHSNEPALITDAHFAILSVNPAFTAVTGIAGGDAVGRPLDALEVPRAQHSRLDHVLAQLTERDDGKGQFQCRRRDGSSFPAWVSLAAVRDPAGRVTQHVLTMTDLTERNAAEQQKAFLAHHDPLTGLRNRAGLKESLERTIAYCRRRRLRFGLLFIDLDHFKPVNDRHGHAVGDSLLKAAAQRLSAGIRGEDTVARLGGDEFIVVLPELRDIEDAKRVAAWVVEELARPFVVDARELCISSSVGISVYPDHALTAEEMLARADSAMYRAKHSGRNAWHVYPSGSEPGTPEPPKPAALIGAAAACAAP